MDRNNNICFFFLGAVLAVAVAEAPYPAAVKFEAPLAPYSPAIPAPVYGVPRIELAPIKQVISSYKYELINPPPRPVEILAPYPAPAPIVKLQPYPAPAPTVQLQPYPVPVAPAPVYGSTAVPVTTRFSYDLPPQPLLKTYAAPAPVASRLEPYPAPAPIVKLQPYPVPVAPAPVYGLPKAVFQPAIPAVPVTTSFSYDLPPQPLLKTYPAPAPVYGLPRISPAVPAQVYGL